MTGHEMESRPTRRGRLAAAAPVLTLSILMSSLALNVFLGWKLRAASTREEARTAGVRSGARLPESVAIVDAAGRPSSLKLRDRRPTLLYVMSPGCVWCRKNEANIRALAVARASDFRVLGLSTRKDKLGEYLDEAALGFPVLALASASQAAALGFTVTPQTVVLTPEGHVEKVWRGALTPDAQKEVERFFAVTLPGLPGV